jgi:hypothetical protein
MKAVELFKEMTAETRGDILSYLHDREPRVYEAALVTLAQQKKFRPQFVLKKTKEQQMTWLVEALKFRQAESIAEQMIQVWLIKNQQPMLASFLDALGLAHDGQGAIDELPGELDPAKTEAAVKGLLEKYSAEKVAVYLHLFQMQQPGGWSALSDILAKEPKLKIGG